MDRAGGYPRARFVGRGGTGLPQMIEQLSRYVNGWRAYFGFCQTPSVLAELGTWIRRRLRSVV